VLDKRLENRGYGVVKQLGEYRGLIGLSQSKGFNREYTVEDAIDSAEDIEADSSRDAYMLGRAEQWAQTAGKLWLVAEFTRVVSPEFMKTVPDSKYENTKHPLADQKEWHVEGQWGLILGSVWEVEPVSCTGGIGAWTPYWCTECHHIQADSQGVESCRKCKAAGSMVPPNAFGNILQLKVVRECEL